MLRSFLTRFPNFLIGVVLLAPCLLVCLACAASPFPLDGLEEGMTTETVRENFGAPKAMEACPSSWSYVHEEQENWFVMIFMTLNPFSVPIRAVAVAIGCPWNTGYVTTNMVLLDFEGEKLVGWDVHEPYTRLPASAREAPGWSRECFPDPPTCGSVRAQGTRTR